jgi:hypothetical protein
VAQYKKNLKKKQKKILKTKRNLKKKYYLNGLGWLNHPTKPPLFNLFFSFAMGGQTTPMGIVRPPQAGQATPLFFFNFLFVFNFVFKFYYF